MNLELRRFARDSLINLGRLAGVSLVSILVSALVARSLGAENKGIYDLAVLIPTLAQLILNVGVVASTLYYLPRADYDLITTLRSSITLSIWLGIIGVLLGVIFFTLGGHLFLPNLPVEYFYIALALLPLFYLRVNLATIFTALQDFRTFGAVELSTPLFTLIFTIIFVVLLNGGTAAALLSLLAANFLAVVFTLFLLRRRVSDVKLRSLFSLQIPRNHFSDIFNYGMKSQINTIALNLLLRIDVLLLNLLGGGAQSVGIYSIAVLIGERIWTFTGFTAYIIAPRIAAWKDNEDQRNAMTVLATRYTLWASLLLAFMLYIFGEWAITLIFGDAFQTASVPLYWLVPGIVMYNLARMMHADIAARGKPGVSSFHAAIALILNLVANLYLIPRYDMVGAALATSIAYTYFGLALAITFCRMNNVRWTNLWLPTNEDIILIRRLYGLLIARLRF